MLIEHINFTDVVAEAIKAMLVVALIFVLHNSGKKYPDLAGGSWNLIIYGFIGIEIGMLLDLSDEFIGYKDMGTAVDVIETFIEEGILVLGFVLITVGFSKWFDFVGKFLGMERS